MRHAARLRRRPCTRSTARPSGPTRYATHASAKVGSTTSVTASSRARVSSPTVSSSLTSASRSSRAFARCGLRREVRALEHEHDPIRERLDQLDVVRLVHAPGLRRCSRGTADPTTSSPTCSGATIEDRTASRSASSSCSGSWANDVAHLVGVTFGDHHRLAAPQLARSTRASAGCRAASAGPRRASISASSGSTCAIANRRATSVRGRR